MKKIGYFLLLTLFVMSTSGYADTSNRLIAQYPELNFLQFILEYMRPCDRISIQYDPYNWCHTSVYNNTKNHYKDIYIFYYQLTYLMYRTFLLQRPINNVNSLLYYYQRINDKIIAKYNQSLPSDQPPPKSKIPKTLHLVWIADNSTDISIPSELSKILKQNIAFLKENQENSGNWEFNVWFPDHINRFTYLQYVKTIEPSIKVRTIRELRVNETQKKYYQDNFKESKYAFVAENLKFHILEKFGGVYIEWDVVIKKNIEFFLREYTSIAVYGGSYVEGFFLASIPHHPCFTNYLKAIGRLEIMMKEFVVINAFQIDNTLALRYLFSALFLHEIIDKSKNSNLLIREDTFKAYAVHLKAKSLSLGLFGQVKFDFNAINEREIFNFYYLGDKILEGEKVDITDLRKAQRTNTKKDKYDTRTKNLANNKTNISKTKTKTKTDLKKNSLNRTQQ